MKHKWADANIPSYFGTPPMSMQICNALEGLEKLGVDVSSLSDGMLAKPTRLICCTDWQALLPCIHQTIGATIAQAGVVSDLEVEKIDHSKKLKALQDLVTWINKTCAELRPRGMVHVRIPNPHCHDPCSIPDCWHDII